MVIQLLIHKGFELALLLFHFRRKSRQLSPRRAHFGNAGKAFCLRFGVLKHVIHHQPDLIANKLAQQAVLRSVWKALFDHAPLVCEEIQFHQVIKGQKPCAKAIVDVVIVIGDIVGHRRDLRFDRGMGSKVERESCIKLGQGPIGVGDRTIVLGQPFEKVPRKVQPFVSGIRAFKPHHGAQRLRIVAKAAVLGHGLGQGVFARVAKGGMAKVMRKAQRLGQVLIHPQGARQNAANLRNLDAVRQARAVMVAIGRDEHLCL